MLDMTKIENKTLKLDIERFDLIEKIQNVIKDFSNELSKIHLYSHPHHKKNQSLLTQTKLEYLRLYQIS